jgi:hypothetical protein
MEVTVFTDDYTRIHIHTHTHTHNQDVRNYASGKSRTMEVTVFADDYTIDTAAEDRFSFIAEERDLSDGRGNDFVVSSERSNVNLMPCNVTNRDMQKVLCVCMYICVCVCDLCASSKLNHMYVYVRVWVYV